MARGVNKVTLIGHLGGDPELRYTANGTAVANLRICTNESYKDKQGNNVEKSEWHSCVAWARLAEICGEYLKKGALVYVEGSLQTRSYDDKDGTTRYVTEIKIHTMQMLGGRGDNSGAANENQAAGRGNRSSGASADENGAGFHDYDAAPASSAPPDDDLPF